jgi:hypothetical protein
MNVCWCRQHEHGDDCHEVLAGCVLLPFLRLFVPLLHAASSPRRDLAQQLAADDIGGTNAALASTLPACASLERQASELLICGACPCDVPAFQSRLKVQT